MGKGNSGQNKTSEGGKLRKQNNYEEDNGGGCC